MSEQGLTASFKQQAAFDHSLLGKMNFFVRAVQKGSITAASEEADLSVSTGSRWISDLEKTLGLKLYNRRGSSITLTHAGQCLFDRFHVISEEVQSLVLDLGGIASEPQGVVKICCTPIYAREQLLPVIGAFNQLYKKVRFSLDIHSYGLKQYDHYDLIISAQTSYQPQETQDLPLVKKNLLCEPFVVVASRDYLINHPEIKCPDELKNHTCLYADSLTPTRKWAFEKGGKMELFSIPDNFEVSDTHLLLEAAKMGVGVAYLPEYVTMQDVEQGNLIRLLSDYSTSNWTLNLYYPHPRHLDHSSLLFKDFFLKQLR
ncbi:MAG: LysR family transcriptional regulator [Endozoicomonas sp.]